MQINVSYFRDCSVVKESTCQCRRFKRLHFDPWVGKIPWRRKWQPTPVFLPGESHGQRSMMGYSPWCRKESDMTDWACTIPSLSSGMTMSRLPDLAMSGQWQCPPRRITVDFTVKGLGSGPSSQETPDNDYCGFCYYQDYPVPGLTKHWYVWPMVPRKESSSQSGVSLSFELSLSCLLSQVWTWRVRRGYQTGG